MSLSNNSERQLETPLSFSPKKRRRLSSAQAVLELPATMEEIKPPLLAWSATFLDASKSGDVASLSKLLDDVSKTIALGLIAAASEGNVDCIKAILSRCANQILSYKDADGNTALMRTVSNNHIDCAITLLKYNHLLSTRIDQCENEALLLAVECGNAEFINLFLTFDLFISDDVIANFGYRALTRAIQLGHEEIVLLVLKLWPPPILFTAVVLDLVDAVRIVLARGKDIDVNEASGGVEDTALLSAVEAANVEIVTLLLGIESINVNQKNINGITPLMAAVLSGETTVVELLLGRPEININERNKYGCTALKLAARHNHGENNLAQTVRLLLKHQMINVNLVDNNGMTALMIAVQDGDEEITKLLLEHPDVDVNQVNALGTTALILATVNDHKSCLSLLLKHKDIKIDQRGPAGRTALMIASSYGRTECAQLLLQFGADAELKDNDGISALNYAPALSSVRQLLLSNLEHSAAYILK